MPRHPQRPRKDKDPDQLKRFKEMAREVEVDESSGAFDRAFAKVEPAAKKKDKRAST